MRYLGIEYAMRRPPELDAGFIPFHAWAEAFLEGAAHPFSVAIEREDAQISVFRSFLRGDDHAEANARYLERFVKFLLWAVGGFRVYLAGCERYARAICDAYTQTGARAFDVGFMRTVYERPVEVIVADPARFPAARESTRAIGGHLEGCRIGFDAGGSDRKVSAVIDGVVAYSEEVEWSPKDARDPRYQFDGIVAAFRSAAAHMPRVDAIGVSSAGVFIGNSPMVSSLFLSVPEAFREDVKTIYDRAAREIGENVPIVVANDGDVTALAGSLSLGEGAVMGVAMGTSEAAGYVTPEGHVLGWFNELAFAPVDLNEQAARDEWSGDIGVGCKYFSQDGRGQARARGRHRSRRARERGDPQARAEAGRAGRPRGAGDLSHHRRVPGPHHSRSMRASTPSAIYWCLGAWPRARAARRSFPSAGACSTKPIPRLQMPIQRDAARREHAPRRTEHRRGQPARR